MSPIEVHRPSDKRYAKVLIFGPAGNGKTYFLGTAMDDERTNPMLVLDFEGGTETLAGLDIDVVSIRSWEDYDEVIDILLTGEHWKLPGSSLKEGEEYKSLGIDSISETHIFALLSIIENRGEEEKDPDLIEQGDYGKGSVQMRRFLREFRDLPLHVFYTSHAKEAEERGVGRIKVPSLAGQMSEEVVGLMSIVGYLARVEGDDEDEELRTLILKDQPKFRTKVRTGWDTTDCPSELDNPTVGSLLDAVGIANTPAKKSRKKSKAKGE